MNNTDLRNPQDYPNDVYTDIQYHTTQQQHEHQTQIQNNQSNSHEEQKVDQSPIRRFSNASQTGVCSSNIQKVAQIYMQDHNEKSPNQPPQNNFNNDALNQGWVMVDTQNQSPSISSSQQNQQQVSQYTDSSNLLAESENQPQTISGVNQQYQAAFNTVNQNIKQPQQLHNNKSVSQSVQILPLSEQPCQSGISMVQHQDISQSHDKMPPPTNINYDSHNNTNSNTNQQCEQNNETQPNNNSRQSASSPAAATQISHQKSSATQNSPSVIKNRETFCNLLIIYGIDHNNFIENNERNFSIIDTYPSLDDEIKKEHTYLPSLDMICFPEVDKRIEVFDLGKQDSICKSQFFHFIQTDNLGDQKYITTLYFKELLLSDTKGPYILPKAISVVNLRPIFSLQKQFLELVFSKVILVNNDISIKAFKMSQEINDGYDQYVNMYKMNRMGTEPHTKDKFLMDQFEFLITTFCKHLYYTDQEVMDISIESQQNSGKRQKVSNNHEHRSSYSRTLSQHRQAIEQLQKTDLFYRWRNTTPYGFMLENYNFTVLLQTFQPDNIILLFTALLLERKVVLIKENIGDIALIMQSLIALLNPFKWSFIVITYLTIELKECLEAPLPFLIGVSSKTWEQVCQLSEYPDDVLIFDCELQEPKQTCKSQYDIPDLPNPFGEKLKSRLKQTIYKKESQIRSLKESRPELSQDQCEEQFWAHAQLSIKQEFFNFLLQTVNNYLQFYNQNDDCDYSNQHKSSMDLFQFKEYLAWHEQQSKKNNDNNFEFIKQFSNTQAFHRFIEENYYARGQEDSKIGFFESNMTIWLHKGNFGQLKAYQRELISDSMLNFQRPARFNINGILRLYKEQLIKNEKKRTQQLIEKVKEDLDKQEELMIELAKFNSKSTEEKIDHIIMKEVITKHIDSPQNIIWTINKDIIVEMSGIQYEHIKRHMNQRYQAKRKKCASGRDEYESFMKGSSSSQQRRNQQSIVTNEMLVSDTHQIKRTKFNMTADLIEGTTSQQHNHNSTKSRQGRETQQSYQKLPSKVPKYQESRTPNNFSHKASNSVRASQQVLPSSSNRRFQILTQQRSANASSQGIGDSSLNRRLNIGYHSPMQVASQSSIIEQSRFGSDNASQSMIAANGQQILSKYHGQSRNQNIQWAAQRGSLRLSGQFESFMDKESLLRQADKEKVKSIQGANQKHISPNAVMESSSSIIQSVNQHTRINSLSKSMTVPIKDIVQETTNQKIHHTKNKITFDNRQSSPPHLAQCLQKTNSGQALQAYEKSFRSLEQIVNPPIQKKAAQKVINQNMKRNKLSFDATNQDQQQYATAQSIDQGLTIDPQQDGVTTNKQRITVAHNPNNFQTKSPSGNKLGSKNDFCQYVYDPIKHQQQSIDTSIVKHLQYVNNLDQNEGSSSSGFQNQGSHQSLTLSKKFQSNQQMASQISKQLEEESKSDLFTETKTNPKKNNNLPPSKTQSSYIKKTKSVTQNTFNMKKKSVQDIKNNNLRLSGNKIDSLLGIASLQSKANLAHHQSKGSDPNTSITATNQNSIQSYPVATDSLKLEARKKSFDTSKFSHHKIAVSTIDLHANKKSNVEDSPGWFEAHYESKKPTNNCKDITTLASRKTKTFHQTRSPQATKSGQIVRITKATAPNQKSRQAQGQMLQTEQRPTSKMGGQNILANSRLKSTTTNIGQKQQATMSGKKLSKHQSQESLVKIPVAANKKKTKDNQFYKTKEDKVAKDLKQTFEMSALINGQMKPDRKKQDQKRQRLYEEMDKQISDHQYQRIQIAKPIINLDEEDQIQQNTLAKSSQEAKFFKKEELIADNVQNRLSNYSQKGRQSGGTDLAEHAQEHSMPAAYQQQQYQDSEQPFQKKRHSMMPVSSKNQNSPQQLAPFYESNLDTEDFSSNVEKQNHLQFAQGQDKDCQDATKPRNSTGGQPFKPSLLKELLHGGSKTDTNQVNQARTSNVVILNRTSKVTNTTDDIGKDLEEQKEDIFKKNPDDIQKSKSEYIKDFSLTQKMIQNKEFGQTGAHSNSPIKANPSSIQNTAQTATHRKQGIKLFSTPQKFNNMISIKPKDSDNSQKRSLQKKNLQIQELDSIGLDQQENDEQLINPNVFCRIGSHMGDLDNDPHTPRSNGSILSGDFQCQSDSTPGRKIMINNPPKQIMLNQAHDIQSQEEAENSIEDHMRYTNKQHPQMAQAMQPQKHQMLAERPISPLSDECELLIMEDKLTSRDQNFLRLKTTNQQ